MSKHKGQFVVFVDGPIVKVWYGGGHSYPGATSYDLPGEALTDALVRCVNHPFQVIISNLAATHMAIALSPKTNVK